MYIQSFQRSSKFSIILRKNPLEPRCLPLVYNWCFWFGTQPTTNKLYPIVNFYINIPAKLIYQIIIIAPAILVISIQYPPHFQSSPLFLQSFPSILNFMTHIKLEINDVKYSLHNQNFYKIYSLQLTIHSFIYHYIHCKKRHANTPLQPNVP